MIGGGSKRNSLRSRKMRSISKRAGCPRTGPKRAHFSKHLKRNKKNKKRVSRKRSSKRIRVGKMGWWDLRKQKKQKIHEYKRQLEAEKLEKCSKT